MTSVQQLVASGMPFAPWAVGNWAATRLPDPSPDEMDHNIERATPVKQTVRITLGVLALLAVGAAQAQAQNTCSANPCSLNDTVKVTVATVLRLTVSQAATALTPPNEAAYDAGFQLDNGPVAGIKSNRAWTVKVSANAATWTAANGARAGKPASDLLWATSSGGTYTGLTTTPATFTSGATGTGNASQQMYYKTLWGYSSDTPGDYSLVVVFTLSAP
jgi:hypothetical protein